MVASDSATVTNIITQSLNPQFRPLIEGLVQYVLSPAIVGGIILFGMIRMLRLGEVKKDFEIIKADVSELKLKSGSIVGNITVIKTHLVDKAGVSAALFQTMSPITLTPSGKKLIEKVGFKDFVKANEEELMLRFEETHVDTLLKVDELSDLIVNEYYEDGKLPSYEDAAFKNGISLEVLLRACSLFLRNYVAEKLSIRD